MSAPLGAPHARTHAVRTSIKQARERAIKNEENNEKLPISSRALRDAADMCVCEILVCVRGFDAQTHRSQHDVIRLVAISCFYQPPSRHPSPGCARYESFIDVAARADRRGVVGLCVVV